MLADNLKPDYYRSKGRPPPIGICGAGDLHHHNNHHHSPSSTASSTASAEDVLNNTDDMRASPSFLINGRRKSPTATPTTPGSSGSFIRQGSASSGNLLGDLNGRPLINMCALSDVDPLLPFDSAASTASSQRTSPVTDANFVKPQPPDLLKVSNFCIISSSMLAQMIILPYMELCDKVARDS